MPILLLLVIQKISAQTKQELFLSDAWRMAEAHYPNTGQDSIWSSITAQQRASIAKGMLPQLALNAQATYQSEVTKLDIPFPGISIDPLSKDQYRATAEVSQLLFDGGSIRARQAVNLASGELEKQKLAIEQYQLRDQVSVLFLQSLYFIEQEKQLALVKDDIETGLAKVTAQVENGVAFRSNQQLLEAELLRTGQRIIDVQFSREGLLQALSILLGTTVDTTTNLQVSIENFSIDSTISRPELKLYNGQQNLLEQQKKILRSAKLPKAQLFVQSGYGKPGLNMLKNQFDFFYIGGVRLNWNFGALYSYQQDAASISSKQAIARLQEASFRETTLSRLQQQAAVIRKTERVLQTDSQIIDLREQVVKAANAQLENGVITANDYLREVNAADQARQEKLTHELQLIQAKVNYLNIQGKTDK